MRIDVSSPISPISAGETTLPKPITGPPQISFGDLLSNVVDSANQTANLAGAKADAVAQGTLDDLHGTMIAAKEAEITMKLAGTIRNKLLDAFHELWRTSV